MLWSDCLPPRRRASRQRTGKLESSRFTQKSVDRMVKLEHQPKRPVKICFPTIIIITASSCLSSASHDLRFRRLGNLRLDVLSRIESWPGGRMGLAGG